jgi:hypothetical protein
MTAERYGESAVKAAEARRLIREDPKLSDREVARRVGTSHSQIARVRAEMTDDPIGHEPVTAPVPEPTDETSTLQLMAMMMDRIESAENVLVHHGEWIRSLKADLKTLLAKREWAEYIADHGPQMTYYPGPEEDG